MATLGAFLAVKPIEPIPESLVEALYDWTQSIEKNDTEDPQFTRLMLALCTIFSKRKAPYTSVRVGLDIEIKWDLRKARVVGRPEYTETSLFQSLISNRYDRNDKASVSGEQSMKRKEAATQESGLRLPRLCLVGKAHQDTLPSQSSAVTPPDDEPPRKRRKYSESSESSDSSDSSDSSEPVQRCGPNDTALPAWILEYKPRVGPKLARACFGKTCVYLATCFEMAGTFLATAMAGQYFIRLFALGDKHLAVEIDFAKWPGCPPQATLSELLRREDIACAFFAGHCMDVTKEFDAESEPVFTPNSAVKTFFEPILLAHGILKDQPSDQLMTALDPSGVPDDLWAQLSEWKGSGSQQPGSGRQDSSGQPRSMTLSDASASHSTMEAVLDIEGSGGLRGLGRPVSVNPRNAIKPRVPSSPTSSHKTSPSSRKVSWTSSSSTCVPSEGSSATINSHSSASSSLTLVPDRPAKSHATAEDTCGMPVDKSTSFADFHGNRDSSNCTGLSKGQDIADEDDLCLGDSAVTLSGYLEDDEEDVDDFYWDLAPEDDIKLTAVSHDTFQALLQCARDRFDRSNARPEFATAP